ncbi:hypothetical protein K525DRAFT_255024 [Schizophyllum commune Loenen D]|nr:hypothetical protein K525DRAFT_255024 [Schizophyllum commune Loenen D]
MQLTLLATALSVASAALAVPSPRGTCDNGSACYSATHGFEYNDKEQYQRNLMDACTADESVTECGDLWGSAACVAAAISFSKIWPGTVQGLAACKNNEIACQADQLDLDQSIFSDIVGGDGSGAMTQQNYIDFIYGTLSAIGSTDYPSSPDELVANGWQPLVAWTATGDSIPYSNFNDFLHYA